MFNPPLSRGTFFRFFSLTRNSLDIKGTKLFLLAYTQSGKLDAERYEIALDNCLMVEAAESRMTKVTKQRTFDDSQVKATEPGKLIAPFIDDTSSSFELILRTLRNGVSFGDNVYCVVKDLELKHNTVQVVGVDKPVDMILVGRNFDRDHPMSAPLHWYYNDQNQVAVIAQFTGSPTIAIKIRTVILFQ